MTIHADMYMLEELIFTLIPVLTSAVPSALLGIASYVLSSMALYSLASRRGIGKAWLSWVPVLNVWIVGSLSDQYRYVVKDQYKSKRKILLILKLVSAVFALAALIAGGFLAADVVKTAMYGVRMEAVARQILGPVLGIAGLVLPIFGLAIASAVVYFMALYDIFQSMDPANGVMFLVLSILFPVTEPFFLFFNREKDKGMPPRRQEYSQPQWEEEEKDYL